MVYLDERKERQHLTAKVSLIPSGQAMKPI